MDFGTMKLLKLVLRFPILISLFGFYPAICSEVYKSNFRPSSRILYTKTRQDGSIIGIEDDAYHINTVRPLYKHSDKKQLGPKLTTRTPNHSAVKDLLGIVRSSRRITDHSFPYEFWRPGKEPEYYKVENPDYQKNYGSYYGKPLSSAEYGEKVKTYPIALPRDLIGEIREKTTTPRPLKGVTYYPSLVVPKYGRRPGSMEHPPLIFRSGFRFSDSKKAPYRKSNFKGNMKMPNKINIINVNKNVDPPHVFYPIQSSSDLKIGILQKNNTFMQVKPNILQFEGSHGKKQGTNATLRVKDPSEILTTSYNPDFNPLDYSRYNSQNLVNSQISREKYNENLVNIIEEKMNLKNHNIGNSPEGTNILKFGTSQNSDKYNNNNRPATYSVMKKPRVIKPAFHPVYRPFSRRKPFGLFFHKPVFSRPPKPDLTFSVKSNQIIRKEKPGNKQPINNEVGGATRPNIVYSPIRKPHYQHGLQFKKHLGSHLHKVPFLRPPSSQNVVKPSSSIDTLSINQKPVDYNKMQGIRQDNNLTNKLKTLWKDGINNFPNKDKRVQKNSYDFAEKGEHDDVLKLPKHVLYYYYNDLDRHSEAHSLLERIARIQSAPAAVIIPGGLAALGLGLAYYYFNYIWYPTPVVTARLSKLLLSYNDTDVFSGRRKKDIEKIVEVFSGLESQNFNSVVNSASCRNRLVCQLHQEIPTLWDVTESISPFISSHLETQSMDAKVFKNYLTTAQLGAEGSTTCQSLYKSCALPYLPFKPLLNSIFKGSSLEMDPTGHGESRIL